MIDIVKDGTVGSTQLRRHSLPFYQLITVMHTEATMVDTQVQVIADDKIKRSQGNKTILDHECITTTLDSFKDGETTPKELLRTVSSI